MWTVVRLTPLRHPLPDNWGAESSPTVQTGMGPLWIQGTHTCLCVKPGPEPSVAGTDKGRHSASVGVHMAP